MENVKSKKELLEESLKIYQRGDGFRSIRNYLERNTTDENLIKEIIQIVSNNKDKIEVSEGRANKVPVRNYIFGSLFLLFGLILLTFLWEKGFIATLPIILMGIGILALTGVIK